MLHHLLLGIKDLLKEDTRLFALGFCFGLLLEAFAFGFLVLEAFGRENNC
jgi:hypothetical protein